MKNIFLSLLLIPSICFSQINEQLQVKPFDSYCLDRKQLEKFLDDFEEKSFLRMFSTRPGTNGRWETFSAVLFTTDNYSSWTLVERKNENLYCIVAMGRELEPAPRQEQDKSTPKSNKL